MREGIGVILFWIIIFSINFFLQDKGKVDKKYSFILTFTFIGIYEFILGILNLMVIGTILLIGCALGYFLYLLIKKKIPWKEYLEKGKDPAFYFPFLLFLYITIIGFSMHLTHYDNFSHWGLIIKTMFTYNRFPNFENTYIMFKGYQPGSACFIYFFGFLCGKTEGCMIVGHNLLISAYYSFFFSFLGKEKRLLKSFLLLSFYIFVMVTSDIAFHNLLVDSLLSFMFLSAFLILREEKKNVKKAIKYMFPIMIYLFLVKNAGLLLDGILCLGILSIQWKNKNLKEGWKQVITIGVLLFIILLIWQGHVTLVYGHWALNTKHSLSPQNFYHSITELGVDNMLTFFKMYLLHFFQLTKNIPNLMMVIINIFVMIQIFITKEKKDWKLLLIVDIIYLGYYVLLGLMYIFSMPWEEAKVFAGYTRYMMTTVSMVIGIILYYFLKEKNHTILIISMILLLIPIYFHQGPMKSLLGKDDYSGTIIEKVDQILDEIPKDGDSYYLYAPTYQDDTGYLTWMMTYKLEKNNIYYYQKNMTLTDHSYIIALEEFEDSDSYQKINNYVYQ